MMKHAISKLYEGIRGKGKFVGQHEQFYVIAMHGDIMLLGFLLYAEGAAEYMMTDKFHKAILHFRSSALLSKFIELDEDGYIEKYTGNTCTVTHNGRIRYIALLEEYKQSNPDFLSWIETA